MYTLSERSYGVSFTTKVKKTGQLFDATTDLGTNGELYRDAQSPLQQDRLYAGHLFDAYPGNSPWVEFSKAEWASFRGDELEEFAASLRLIPVR